jgi:hypothetical protein
MMAYLIPAWELDENKRERFRMGTQEAMIRRAEAILARRKEKFTVRKLTPSDMGLFNWTVAQGNPVHKWIHCVVPNNCVYGIYKLSALSLDPTAQFISIKRGYAGSMTLFSADLSEMYAGLNIVKALFQSDYDVVRVTEVLSEQKSHGIEEFMKNKELRCEAYLTEPCIFDPNDYVYIEISPPSNDTLIIVGFVVEPVGTTVI